VKGAHARALPYAAVAISACSWGTWALLLRTAEAIAPISAPLESTVVMAVITAVSALTMLRDRTTQRASWKARAWVAWLGVSDALNLVLFFAAMRIVITVAVLVHYLTPVLVAIGAPLLLREKLTRRTALAVTVSVVGLVIMLAPSSSPQDRAAAWWSAALAGGSAVFYASNVIVNKHIALAFSPSEAMFWHGLVATPLLATIAARGTFAAPDPRALGFLALVAIGPGALAGLAYVWGLRRMPATHASTLTLVEPLVAVALGAAVYGEPFGARTVIGGTLILGASVYIMWRPGTT
jgi:drug/metabolite transporter (DMT)-like permease